MSIFKFFLMLFNLLFVVACGSGDEVTGTGKRVFTGNQSSGQGGGGSGSPETTPNEDPPNEAYTIAVNRPLIRTSDCVFESGKCGGVLPIDESIKFDGNVDFKIRAFADPTRWIQLGYPFPDDYVLTFNCELQTCSLGADVCKSKAYIKDIANEFWSKGPMNGVSLKKYEQAVFPVSRELQTTQKMRVFCHYHWLLDEVESSRPLGIEYTVRP